MSTAGLVAWAVGSLFFFYAFVLRVSPSVMVDELMRDFDVSALALGNLSAFYFYAYASVQIPVGVLMGRVGPRRLMSAAALLCAFGCVVFAQAESVVVAYTGRLIIGFGCAFSWVGVLTIIGQRLPSKHFAAFTGGGQLAGTAGAIMGQAPLALAVGAFGWQASMSGLGVLGIALAIALWLTVRDDRGEQNATYSLRNGLLLAARNPQTWLLSLIGLSLTGPVLAFAGLWGVPWLEVAHGFDKAEGAKLVSLVFIGWLFGAPLIGWCSDRLGRRKPLLLIGTILSTGSIYAVISLPQATPELLSLLLIVNGIGGSSMILTFASGREHNEPIAVGSALGIINTCVVGSGALFQPLIGGLLDWYWAGGMHQGVRVYEPAAFDVALLALPVGGLLGLVCALCLRESHPSRSHS